MPDPSPSSEPATVRQRPLLHGIDASAYQGVIDWPRVRAAGMSFAWVKATEGGTHVDARFVENWSGAWAAGLMRGAYCFLTTSAPIEEQAALFLRTYPGAGELAPVLDLERGINGGEPTAANALAWVGIVEKELGLAPWIYCSPSYAAAHLQGEAGLELAARCRLWVASWRMEPPGAVPPWSAWSAWQTGRGRIDGIACKVDLDVMRGDALGLAQVDGAG